MIVESKAMRSAAESRSADAIAQATTALNNNRPQDAERLAAEALRADRGNSVALSVLADALMMQGRRDDAIAVLEGHAKRDARIETQLGAVFQQAGRNEEALTQLRRAIKRKPPFAPAFLQLGALLSTMKRYAEAIEILERGREIAPTMPELPIRLGYVFLEQRKPAMAKRAFAAALNIAPSLPAALWGMGKAHQEVGENREAIDYFRRRLGLMPGDPDTMLALGHCLLEIGEIKSGLDYFRIAARGDQARYFNALTMLVKSGHGRFWLRPSDAKRYLQGQKN